MLISGRAYSCFCRGLAKQASERCGKTVLYNAVPKKIPKMQASTCISKEDVMQMTGAELVVKALLAEQVDTLFAYPGGQAIDLFDALYKENGIRIIQPRHEQGLIHAADGYARATGKTGVCLVTSGPGAMNLVTGIATAGSDSVPLVCITGQVPTRLIGNAAFQEADIVSITKSITKYAVTVRDRRDLARILKQAFTIASSGRKGVAVVDLPKDIQQETGDSDYPPEPMPQSCRQKEKQPQEKRCQEQMKKAQNILSGAKMPLFLLGNGVRLSGAEQEVTKLAEKTGIPAVTTILGKGALPTNHPLYVGNIGIHGSYAANMAVSKCDALCVIGTRLNDRVTGNAAQFASGAEVIQIDLAPESVSREIRIDLSIALDAKKAASLLLEQAAALDTALWQKKISGWKREYPLGREQKKKNGVTPYRILQEINALFPNALVTTDVGQNQLWAAQFLEITGEKRLFTSGGMGTMGYGLPAAIGAQLADPYRNVLAICGDGGIQMNIQELATAVAYELPVIICVLNNGYLGNVRQWQQFFYGKRYSGTRIKQKNSCLQERTYTPDFVKLAHSYGAGGIRVEKPEEIRQALLCAKEQKKAPVLIEFMIEEEENVLPIVPPGKPLWDMIVSDTCCLK